jgi:hypothetical protein
MPAFQYLPMAVKNVSLTLEDILTALKEAPAWRYEPLYFERISSLYRQLGIGEFLLSDDETSIHARLQLGVQAYIEFLQNAERSELAASKALPFFDAVCLGDQQAMATLSRLSPAARNSRKEYEEDFLYMRIMMDFFGLRKTLDQVKPLLAEFESFHVDYPDQRFSLLVALFDKDSRAFAEALEVLIDERVARYADGGDAYVGTRDEAAILAHVSAEVIAWVKLAKQQGLAIAQEYTLAPGSAVVDSALSAPPPRGWLAFQSQSRSFGRL